MKINNMQNLTGITSPESGREYTVKDLISKFLERGQIIVSQWERTLVNSSKYGDSDWVINATLKSEPKMSRSTPVTLQFSLPVHVDYTGKLSLGFATGDGFNPEVVVARMAAPMLFAQLFAPDEYGEWDTVFHWDERDEITLVPGVYATFKEAFFVEVLRIVKEVIIRETVGGWM